MRKYTQKELKNMVALGQRMLRVQTMRIMKRLSKEKIIFLRSDIPLAFMVVTECY